MTERRRFARELAGPDASPNDHNGIVLDLVYNPFDPAEIVDPYPTYRRLLTESPVLSLPAFSGHVITSWERVRWVLADRSFSADRERSTFLQSLRAGGGMPQTQENLFGRSLLAIDPPDHTRLRRLVGTAFTPRRVEELESRVAQIADALLDDLPGDVDLMDSFANRLPVLVIAELLGLPAQDHDLLKRWSDDVALLLDPFPTVEAVAAFNRSVDEFHAYLEEQFEARRHRPTHDLISALVAVREGEDLLTPEDLFSMVVLLVAAGHETTTNLIGNSVVALTSHPDQRRRLVEEPGLSANAVEELLRYDSPVQRTSRVVVEPISLDGVEAVPGELLFLVIGAANRDAAHFADPDRLDLSRPNARDHLAFSHGIHYCLGAPLARLEGRVSLRRLFDRWPVLEVDLDRLEWRSSIILRGPKRLPVRLGPVSRHRETTIEDWPGGHV